MKEENASASTSAGSNGAIGKAPNQAYPGVRMVVRRRRIADGGVSMTISIPKNGGGDDVKP